jgi:hypothetical protein
MEYHYSEVGVSVKDHTPYSFLASKVPGLSELDENTANEVYEVIREDFWNEANAVSETDFACECSPAGRSGGWAVAYDHGGIIDPGDDWRHTIRQLADTYINEVWPQALRDAVKEQQAERMEAEAEDIRLSLIGTDEKVAAADTGLHLARALVKLSRHFDLDVNELLREAREEN